MSHVHETVEEQSPGMPALGEPVPGVVAIFSCGQPLYIPIPIAEGPIELGRMTTEGAFLDDERISRRHVRVEAARERFRVTDLGSRNGTYVDGERVEGSVTLEGPRVLRMGRSLLLFVTDVRPFERIQVTVRKDVVIGPRLAQAWARITRAAQLGTSLLITGASGTGKELAARHFHASSSRPEGPFVAVNCAAIPAGVAERLLFGARKGAFSGATDAEGYAQAAHGGTLFLDEVGELESGVQAKLLRLLESGEVMPLGAARPQRVELRVVAAALKDLRTEAAAGRFREDLYYRLGQPEVRLPPLRERLEELPWLVQAELARMGPEIKAHALFIEACVMRTWPGNVRELAHEVRQAAQNALASGRTLIEVADLEPSAGAPLGHESQTSPETPAAGPKPSDEQILEVLKREAGNVSRAARALGMHRNQLRRWLARRGADPSTFGSSLPDTELE